MKAGSIIFMHKVSDRFMMKSDTDKVIHCWSHVYRLLLNTIYHLYSWTFHRFLQKYVPGLTDNQSIQFYEHINRVLSLWKVLILSFFSNYGYYGDWVGTLVAMDRTSMPTRGLTWHASNKRLWQMYFTREK